MSGADTVFADEHTATKIDLIARAHEGSLKNKILVTSATAEEGEVYRLKNSGWIPLPDIVDQSGNPPCPENLDTSADEVMQIFFTSGTTGEPKMCPHTHGSGGYCHWVTGKYWLDLTSTDLHWNISDTGWVKSAWSTVFAPWYQGAGVFVNDMPRYKNILVM